MTLCDFFPFPPIVCVLEPADNSGLPNFSIGPLSKLRASDHSIRLVNWATDRPPLFPSLDPQDALAQCDLGERLARITAPVAQS